VGKTKGECCSAPTLLYGKPHHLGVNMEILINSLLWGLLLAVLFTFAIGICFLIYVIIENEELRK